MNQLSQKLISLSLFLFLFSVREDISAQTYRLWGDLTPGLHRVGFKVVNKYDYTRTFKTKYDDAGQEQKGERAWPLQVSLSRSQFRS